jgi:hypothetical protein
MILLFAGAGASAAVNKVQYPTTLEFWRKIPESLRQRPVFTLVDQLLRRLNNLTATQSAACEMTYRTCKVSAT